MMRNPSIIPGSGPMSGRNIIGEVTESVQKFIYDGWIRYSGDASPPRIEEDLTYESMDRNEQVVYVYMYRLAANPNLQNQKRLRQAPVYLKNGESEGNVYHHRPPVLIDLFYMLAVHSRFRSEAERLLGWLILLLNEATHLIYRPRKFILPNGREIDSLGRDYDPKVSLDEDGLQIEKVSLAMVDDLTVGDAVNFFSSHEAPYRPFLTYRARIALDGPLVHAGDGIKITMPRLAQNEQKSDDNARRNGRVLGRAGGKPERQRIGPKRHNVKKDTD